MTSELTLCRCGDSYAAHEHYRSGTDCSSAPCRCTRFRRVRTSTSGKGTAPRHQGGPRPQPERRPVPELARR